MMFWPTASIVAASCRLSLCCAFISLTASASVTSLSDIQFWTGSEAGPGISQAVFVLDWSDGQPGVAWGYRWPATEGKTGLDMLAAIAAAEPRLSLTGLTSGFVGNIRWDGDLNGQAERERGSFDSSTGAFWDYFVNNEVYFHPTDFLQNGHIVPPAQSVQPLGSPYDEAGAGRWVESSTGAATRPLVDGSWDGFVWAPFGGTGPAELTAALPIPEPTSFVFAASALFFYASRSRRRS